ncbi:MAG: glutathione peroxidase [Anaerophaga sp.]|nr:glutathione peroxidase [Anaerophaga sp.]
MESDFYLLKAKKPNGEILKIKSYKGKTVLIVNTATKCDLAPQFEGLEALH